MERFTSRLMWIFFILGFIFIFNGAKDAIDSQKTPSDFNSMKETDIQNDMIVEGDIPYNFGAFEEEYRTTYGIKTGDSDYTYLIPIGEKKYMGIKNQTNEQQVVLDNQADQTIDLMLGDSAVEPTSFHFKGRITTMDSQDKGYMRNYLLDMGYTESEVDGYILGYRIECVDFNSGMGELGIGVVLFAIGLAILITPWLERKRKERLLYTNDTATYPVINRYNEDVDTYSSELNHDTPSALKYGDSNSETLKMPSRDADSDTLKMPSGDTDSDMLKMSLRDSDSNTLKMSAEAGSNGLDSEEQGSKSGLKLKLKD